MISVQELQKKEDARNAILHEGRVNGAKLFIEEYLTHLLDRLEVVPRDYHIGYTYRGDKRTGLYNSIKASNRHSKAGYKITKYDLGNAIFSCYEKGFLDFTYVNKIIKEYGFRIYTVSGSITDKYESNYSNAATLCYDEVYLTVI